MGEEPPHDPEHAPGASPETREHGRRPPSQEEGDSARAGRPSAERPPAATPPVAGETVPPHPRSDLRPAASAREIGPYRILGELGRGGMGVVYKAFHPGLKRTLALKVLITGEDASEEAIARFHREAESVAKLGHHPNIVPVYDIGQAPGPGSGAAGHIHYIAMHFVDGKPLDRAIDEGTITPKRAAEIAKKVAQGLQHAHGHGILHRDVKPANVLLAKPGERRTPVATGPEPEARPAPPGPERSARNPPSPLEDWEPMLTDFGLAKDVESRSRMTRSGMTLGTPNYMPPEQAEGDLSRVDARSDVYSLGATLYEMLTGRPPFDGETVAQVIRGVLLEDPRSPRRANPSVDRDLETICLKCLEKEPARRFSSAGDLAEELGLYLGGRPLRVRPVSLWEKALRRVRRNRPLAAVIGLFLLTLLGSAGAASLTGVRMKADRELKDREKARVETGRAEAERRASAAEELLRKSRTAATLLRLVEETLGDETRAMKRAAWSGGSGPEIQAFARTCWGRVEAFGREVPDDPASRAAWLAYTGWLRRLTGSPGEASSLFAEARAADPDLPYGWLFEGMGFLSDYVSAQRLPRFRIGNQGVEFERIPPETADMAAHRREAERILEGMKACRVWGDSASKDVLGALEGFRRFQGRDFPGALRGLNLALAVPELSFMREEILLARAKTRFVMKDFPSARRDADEALKVLSGSAEALLTRGYILQGLGVTAVLADEDPSEFLDAAERAFSEVVEKAPGDAEARISRAALLLNRGRLALAKGEDPVAYADRALADQEAVLLQTPESVPGLLGRGNANALKAEWRVRRREDPRDLLRLALEDFERGAARAPRNALAFAFRAEAQVSLSEWTSNSGGDPRERIRSAIDDFTRAVALDPGLGSILCNRGVAFCRLAEAERKAGGDPEEIFEKSAEDFGAVIRDLPEFRAIALYDRGCLLSEWASSRMKRGAEPGTLLERAKADFLAALRAKPRDAHACREFEHAVDLLSEAARKRGEDGEKPWRGVLESPDTDPSGPLGRLAGSLLRGDAARNLAVLIRRKGGDPLGTFAVAIGRYTDALAEWPRSDHALIGRARCHTEAGSAASERGMEAEDRFDNALRDCEGALRISPFDPGIVIQRGQANQALGEHRARQGRDSGEAFGNAFADFGRAIEMDPGSAIARLRRGSASVMAAQCMLEAGGDPESRIRSAIRDLDLAIEMDPSQAEAFASRGSAKNLLADLGPAPGRDPGLLIAEGIRDFETALSLDLRDLLLFNNLGNACLRLAQTELAGGRDARGSCRKAVSNYERALAQDPAYVPTLCNCGFAHQQLGAAMAVFGEESGPCFEKANELYARALQTNPKYVSAYANLGLLLHRLGRFEESVQVFEKGLAVVRGRFPAMVQWRDETAALARMPAWKREILLAENLRNIGDFRAAQRFFERGIAGIRASPAAPPEETAESRRIAHAGLARLFAQASEGRHGASAPATPVPPEDLRASRERSLAHLKEAMGLGWDPRQGGRDLDPLRGLPEFEALTKEQREKPAKGEGK